MAEDLFLHLDPTPWSCTNMGSLAKKRDARSLDMRLMPRKVETMEHLTNACKFSDNLWKQHQILEINDKNPNNMETTIDN